jgi:hypothetical protein
MSTPRDLNYSVRQNKAIERSIIFDALSALSSRSLLSDPIYVGFGSVWFVDFRLAHRLLGIEDMYSFEVDRVRFSRAEFNRPYRTVQVIQGNSRDQMRQLLSRPALKQRSWITWLDYDDAVGSDEASEVLDLVSTLPANSVLMATFNVSVGGYSDKPDRKAYLSQIFGEDLVAIHERGLTGSQSAFTPAFAGLMSDAIRSRFVKSGREGSVVRIVSLAYRDNAPMATVGFFIGDAENCAIVEDLTNGDHWPAVSSMPIATSALTYREVAGLCSLLPSKKQLSTQEVSSLGFTLSDRDIRTFEEHYLRYPIYSEVNQSI